MAQNSNKQLGRSDSIVSQALSEGSQTPELSEIRETAPGLDPKKKDEAEQSQNSPITSIISAIQSVIEWISSSFKDLISYFIGDKGAEEKEEERKRIEASPPAEFQDMTEEKTLNTDLPLETKRQKTTSAER